MFFGACVAFRCALWPAARQHVNRALDLLPKGPKLEDERHEIQHLLAVSIRFAINNAQEFMLANLILLEAAEYYTRADDPLGQARALSERATLNLWAAGNILVLPGRQFPRVR